MALSFDEIWCYGGQLVVSEPGVYAKALGGGLTKIPHSVYIQGPSQFGKPDAYGAFPPAVVNMGQNGVHTPLTSNIQHTLWVKGNTRLEGDSQSRHGLSVSGGSSVDTVYISGDMYVTGKVDCGNKGRLASRFAAADASPKPFDLVHPTKGKGHRLRYACIEGPEVGVYYRGRLRNQTQIALPYYWKDLVNTQSISVQIQPIRAHQDIIVKRWDEEFIYLQANGGLPIDCFYHVYAERKDINPLHVEYEGETWEAYPDPNFNPNTAPDPEDPNRFNDPQYRGLPNTVTI